MPYHIAVWTRTPGDAVMRALETCDFSRVTGNSDVTPLGKGADHPPGEE